MANYYLSAFADEAGDSIQDQINALKDNGISYIEPRFVNGKGILALSEAELYELEAELSKNGIKVGSLGSPIGKYDIKADFETHLKDFDKAITACKILKTDKMRMFSFYVKQDELTEYKDEVIKRLQVMCDIAKENGIILCHENESEIYGQMPPEELEKIIMGFVNHDYDVLIATSIVENGIDIPNANTIIINAAHNFGLSDLHQMRGRVGRGNKKAFCYLLAPPLSGLTPEARRRLQAIENFTDLGSGIHIAMQDLDIRGAGNLLGAEQSGFIADLGYETYQKILGEAVHELKTNEFADLIMGDTGDDGKISGEGFVEECAVESDLELLFPDEYIPTSSERMLVYRELDSLESDEELKKFRTRLIDRFGPVPPTGEELLRVVPLRRLGKQLGIEKILLKGSQMALYFVSNLESPYYDSMAFGRVMNYTTMSPYECRFRELSGKRSLLIKGIKTVEEALSVLSMMMMY